MKCDVELQFAALAICGPRSNFRHNPHDPRGRFAWAGIVT
jgi:hypothetical protein